MADEIKKEENKETKGSTIKKIKEPDFSKEVVIDKLTASKEMIDWHFNKMREALGNKATNEEIWKRINSLVLRDNVFNEAMKIIVPCYEIKIIPEQLKQISELLRKGNPSLKEAPEPFVNMMGQRMIEKQMIFACLAREWKVEISDAEAQGVLENYYRQTNQPIRDILSNPKAMEGVKNTMLEQKLADMVCSKLKWKADWESIRKNAQINNAQVEKQKEDAKKAAESTDTKDTKPIEK